MSKVQTFYRFYDLMSGSTAQKNAIWQIIYHTPKSKDRRFYCSDTPACDRTAQRNFNFQIINHTNKSKVGHFIAPMTSLVVIYLREIPFGKLFITQQNLKI